MSFSFFSLPIVFTMPIRKDRPFKSPRQAKPTEVTKDSDKVDRPISQTLEKTNQSFVHRNDNSEWVKRMEKTLGEMDKRKEAAAKLQITAKILIEMENSQTPLQSKRQSVLRRRNTAQGKTSEDDERSKHSREIGKTVARDFGDARRCVHRKDCTS